jgi:hypothetical protein
VGTVTIVLPASQSDGTLKGMTPKLQRCGLPAFGLVLALTGGCGQLDNPANTDYNRFENKKPPTIVRPISADASACSVPDAGTCTTGFAKDVVPIFNETTCTTGSCHGGAASPNMPKDDLKAMWDTLRATQNVVTKLPYINNCSLDPADSYIIDNLRGVKEKGGRQMPLGPALTADQVTTIEKWVKCGAPFN